MADLLTTRASLQPTGNDGPVSDSVDRILRVATELFAQHGFDGVTTRQIAAGAGLNIATVHHHVGTKGELYRRVLAALTADEAALVADFRERLQARPVDSAEALFELLESLIDGMVQLVAAKPSHAHLSMRRWMQSDAEVRSIGVAESLQLHLGLRAVLEDAEAKGLVRCPPCLSTFLRSFDWIMYSYFISGPVVGDCWYGDPQASESLSGLRDFLHDYLRRMLRMDATCVQHDHGRQ